MAQLPIPALERPRSTHHSINNASLHEHINVICWEDSSKHLFVKSTPFGRSMLIKDSLTVHERHCFTGQLSKAIDKFPDSDSDIDYLNRIYKSAVH